MLWQGWSVFPCEPRDASLRPLGEGRPPGLHLGAVLHRMKVAAGDKVDGVEGDQEGVRMQRDFSSNPRWSTSQQG